MMLASNLKKQRHNQILDEIARLTKKIQILNGCSLTNSIKSMTLDELRNATRAYDSLLKLEDELNELYRN